MTIDHIDSKKAFIQLALQYEVLKFGNFTLKSGRNSPYFFDMGLFHDGNALKLLGQFYANLLRKEADIRIEHLFGAAYKGIPLASATAIALADYGINPKLTFNRKEIKTHGEGGQLIGAPLSSSNIIVIDDVITAGTAFRDAKQHILNQGGNISCLVVALDRCEAPNSLDVKVLSIITIFDVIAYLREIKEERQALCLEAYVREN